VAAAPPVSLADTEGTLAFGDEGRRRGRPCTRGEVEEMRAVSSSTPIERNGAAGWPVRSSCPPGAAAPCAGIAHGIPIGGPAPTVAAPKCRRTRAEAVAATPPTCTSMTDTYEDLFVVG
jgi:hypothetical protein